MNRTMHTLAVPRRAPLLLMAALLLTMAWGPGCYHSRVLPPQPNPATEYEKRTVHALAWGLVQQNTFAEDCRSNALDEVRISSNLGYSILTVVTLGFWMPLEVEWRCAKNPVDEGEFGAVFDADAQGPRRDARF